MLFRSCAALALALFGLMWATQTQAIVIPNMVVKPIIRDLAEINKSTDAIYQCEQDHQAMITLARAGSGPKLGAVVYAFSYREYAERIKSVKDGMWKVTRIDGPTGIRFVKKFVGGQATGKEYRLDRFSHFEKVSGKQKIGGRCYQVGKQAVMNSGASIGKIVAIGDIAMAIEYEGKVVVEQARYFKGNCQ